MLIPSSTSDVIRRFDHFNDSVLGAISVDYAERTLPRIQITLTCQDDEADEPTWRSCRIDFHNVREFRIEQRINSTQSVISFGIAITIEAGITFVDFDCLGDTERPVEQIRSSDFHIGAERVDFIVL